MSAAQIHILPALETGIPSSYRRGSVIIAPLYGTTQHPLLWISGDGVPDDVGFRPGRPGSFCPGYSLQPHRHPSKLLAQVHFRQRGPRFFRR